MGTQDSGCLRYSPAVAKHLQVEAQRELQYLTPRAIRTIAGLLTNKSGYIRLDAAKEVLKANGIGQSKDSAAAQPLLISIQINNKEMGGEIGAGLGTDGRSAASALAGGTEAA